MRWPVGIPRPGLRFWSVESQAGYWADFALLPAQMIMLVVLADATRCGVALGVVLWTLIEYILHRHVFHGNFPLIRRAHADHHRDPGGYRGVASLPTLIATQALLWTSVANDVAGVMLGLMSGYLWYIATHALCHSDRVGCWMAATHARHHHRAAKADYGVTSPFWDFVFRTRSARHIRPTAQRMDVRTVSRGRARIIQQRHTRSDDDGADNNRMDAGRRANPRLYVQPLDRLHEGLRSM